MERTVFVGNLDYDTTEDTLREVFDGRDVDDVRIARDRLSGDSRGFGFVTMGSVAAARRAIAELEGTRVDGRRLVVGEAHGAHRPTGSG